MKFKIIALKTLMIVMKKVETKNNNNDKLKIEKKMN